MSDEGFLREKVRDAIRAGKLPKRRPDSMWGGPGVGAACAICSAPVKHHDVELEVEFARGNGHPGLDRYRVHAPCFAAWELELDQATAASMAGRPSESSTGSAVSRRALPEATNVCKITGNGRETNYKRGSA